MEPEQRFTPLPRHLQLRVGLMLGLTLALALAFIGYLLYARGFFEATQGLTLLADNAEGVSVGDDLTVAGFPVGRVRDIALGEDGRARVQIEVPLKNAHWLRTNTAFSLERGFFGGAHIRADARGTETAALPQGAVRPLVRRDSSDEIPRLVASTRSILDNVEQITAANGHLQAGVANLRVVTDRAAGRHGVAGALLGEEDAKRLLGTLEGTNRLLVSLNAAMERADALVARADERIFAPDGAVEGSARALGQVNEILGDVREMLKRTDRLLADAEQVAGNAKAASADLASLRAEVDESVRNLSGLIDEINRKWPFERNTEIRLP